MTTKPPTKAIITAQVSSQTIAELNRIAERQQVARSVIMRRALDAYIKRFPKPMEEETRPAHGA